MLCMFGQCPLLAYTETGTVTFTWEPGKLHGQMSAPAIEHNLNCLNSAVMSLLITAAKAPHILQLKWTNWTLTVLIDSQESLQKNLDI